MQIKGVQRTRESHSALEPQISAPLPRYEPALTRCALLSAMMSLRPSLSPRFPRPARSLCALLALLLLLTPPAPLANAGPVAAVVRELRCVCLSTTPGVHPKMVTNLQVIAAGPQCSKVEVVASLKNGKEVCLDPEAPLIKKIVQKILDGGNKN
ncbi:C-X-C motif chemokine 5 [Marmota marmota marmota]|uniref:C-X-C motif chemokine 5 n=1 Tax=Marmota marmota marmota TaxID=9994 RepID=UPI0007623A11|nr:C-X-C motif chemokine 5 [Marmota marmota marmota]